jgi:hypothetical protein
LAKYVPKNIIQKNKYLNIIQFCSLKNGEDTYLLPYI